MQARMKDKKMQAHLLLGEERAVVGLGLALQSLDELKTSREKIESVTEQKKIGKNNCVERMRRE